MSPLRLHRRVLIAPLPLVSLLFAACAASTAPQLKVLGVERAKRNDSVVVFVEVVNHAPRPMQLERLQYSFGADGAAEPSTGELSLDRTVEAGAAVTVQVPLDLGTTAI